MDATITIPIKFPFDPEPLNKAIKQQRLTQRALAQESGYHYVHISRVLNGGPASVEIIDWLCTRLGVARSLVIGPAPYLSILPPS